MALDENGNVKSSGWGKALGDVAGLIAGNPKADAEAENFRTVGEANKIKLEEARRAAARDKALDPARETWRSLWTETEVPGPANGPTEVLADGLGVNPAKVKKPAAIRFEGERGFVFDQARIPEIISSGTELYGPDFVTKMHGFLTKAGPAWNKLTDEERNKVTREGIESITGGIPMSETSKGNAASNTMAIETGKAKAGAKVAEIEAKTKADIDHRYGTHPNPHTGGIHIGKDGVIAKILAAGATNPETKQEAKPGSGWFAEPAPAPDPEASIPMSNTSDPHPTPSTDTANLPPLFSGNDLNPPVTKQYSEDKKKATSGKIAEQISSGVKVTRNPDGSYSLLPQEPARSMNPSEQSRAAANDIGRNSLPTGADLNKTRELDDQWAAGLAARFGKAVADEKGHAPGPTLLEPIVNGINNLRLDLERRGVPGDEARSIAFQMAQNSFRKYMRTDWDMKGENQIELIGSEQIKKGADGKEKKVLAQEPDDWNWYRPWSWDTSGPNVDGIKAAKIVSDDVAANETNRIPNMYIDKPTYDKNLPDTLTSLGVHPDYHDNEELKALGIGLLWMKDVYDTAPGNGYRFSETAGVGQGHVVRTMRDPAAYMKALAERIQQTEQYIKENY